MYHLNLLTHWRKLLEALPRIGAKARLDFDTMKVEITRGDDYLELVPEFASWAQGRVRYSSELTPQIFGFTGWRIAPRQPSELMTDRLKFKEFCAQHQLRVPRTLARNSADRWVALIKTRGVRAVEPRRAITGPFSPENLGAAPPGVEVFLEEFIKGHGVEAWYCEGKLACVVQRGWSEVVGDSRSTVKALIDRGYGAVDHESVRPLLQSQGYDLGSMPASGARIAVDYKFNSGFQSAPYASEDSLTEIRSTDLYGQLAEAGPILLKGLPPDAQRNALFCVSGVIDEEKRVWFTSMHEGRVVYPDVYSVMLHQHFRIPEASAVPPELTQRTA